MTNTAGPFQVTAPNSNITWNAGSTATVTWSVNGTNAGTVNCAAVNILCPQMVAIRSPVVLASATANDGSEVVNVPATQGTTNRIKVEAVGNIFFDISNTNFTIGAPPLCADAAGLASSAITQTTATLGWTADASALSYDVDYKTTASSTWINAATATTATAVNLSGLTAGTTYDWRVRINCAAGAGNYVQAQFTTSAATVVCPGIYDVSTNGTTAGAATIPLNTDVKGLINVGSDNDYYKFVITNGGTLTITLSTLPANYQLSLLNSAGTVLQTSSNAGTNNETISGTIAAGTYYARVFPRNTSTFNASVCYTLRVQTGTASKIAIAEEITTGIGNKFSVYPNPARNFANLAFNAEVAGNAKVLVINQTGSEVIRKTIPVNEGANTAKVDINHLANGVYFVKIQTGSLVQMAKLVIEQ